MQFTKFEKWKNTKYDEGLYIRICIHYLSFSDFSINMVYYENVNGLNMHMIQCDYTDNNELWFNKYWMTGALI